MAPPIPFKPATQDSGEPQQKRITDAPLAHADAILSAYDLLQKLHDSGTLDLLRGVAGSRDTLVEQLASVLDMPEAVQASRNLIVLGKALGSIDSGLLKSAVAATAQPRTAEAGAQPPSLWELGKRARSEDARRGLAMVIGVLEALGRASKK